MLKTDYKQHQASLTTSFNQWVESLKKQNGDTICGKFWSLFISFETPGKILEAGTELSKHLNVVWFSLTDF